MPPDIPSTPPAAPKPRRRTLRILALVGACVAIAAVVTISVLATVPIAQRVSFQTVSPVSGPTLRGCGETDFELGSWGFPAGKLVHISWTTTPVTQVFVNMSWASNSSWGPTFFSAEEGSGATSFDANGAAYAVNVTNCQSQPTTIIIAAFYDTSAPAL